jgi:hypothetical protein
MLIVALVFGLGAALAEPSKNPPVLETKRVFSSGSIIWR